MNEAQADTIRRATQTTVMAAVAALLLGISLTTPARALTIAGIEIPGTLEVGEHLLTLNGAGLRKKLFVEAYVACLYVPQPGGDPRRILAADEPQAVIMHITSDMVTRDRLTAGLPKDLARATGNNMKPIKDRTERLLAMIDSEVASGDMFRLIYLPGQGTQIWHNDRFQGLIEGLEFKQALFGIWLSDNPTQKSLKQDLLDPESVTALND